MTDLKTFIRKKGLTQKEFSEKTGVDIYQLSRVISGKMPMSDKILRNIIAHFPEYEYQLTNFAAEPMEQYLSKKIPFYDVEVFATISPAMSDVVALKPSAFINIPMFSQGEYALQVTGHSMKGLINHGDWIVVKRITNRNSIIYGEPYLVVTKSDNLKTVKFVKPSEDDDDSLCLIPYNIEQFDPQDIKKEEILEMYRVIGLFRST